MYFLIGKDFNLSEGTYIITDVDMKLKVVYANYYRGKFSTESLRRTLSLDGVIAHFKHNYSDQFKEWESEFPQHFI